MEPIEDLRRLLASPDEEIRRSAVSALATFPFRQVKDLALDALGDESWRVRKEAVDLILAVSPEDELARELVSLLAVQGNTGLKNSLVEVLQAVGERALPHLVEQISHENAGVRKLIVDTMGGIGSATVMPELAAALADSDANVAAAAAESLGAIGDADAVPYLLRTLERDDLLIRYAILEALVKIGTPVPLGVVTHLATDPLLKKALFECLGVIGDLTSLPLLVEGLTDRARNVREAALNALAGLLRRTSADEFSRSAGARLKALAGTVAVEHLMAMAESQDLMIRRGAITLLGCIADLRAVDLFLKGCRDENLLPTVLEAFRLLGDSAGRALLDRYGIGDDEDRLIIAYLSGEINLAESGEITAAAMADPMPMVRAFAAEAAGKSGAAGLIPQLKKLLKDENAEVRKRATGAQVRLAAVARESVLESALQLAETDNPDCRLQAVTLFGALRENSHLIFLSKDEDSFVRREAITVLGTLHVPESAGRLLLALADENDDVRLAAATALGWSGFADESGALLLSLEDSSQRVQSAAIKSLGLRREPAAFAGIARFIASGPAMPKIAALYALTEIDPVKAAPLLRQAADDGDAEVAGIARKLHEEFSERV